MTRTSWTTVCLSDLDPTLLRWMLFRAHEEQGGVAKYCYPGQPRLPQGIDRMSYDSDSISGMTKTGEVAFLFRKSSVIGYCAYHGIQLEKLHMSDDNKKPSVLNTIKTDASDAAWRTAGSQFVKLTRDPLAAILARHLGPEDDAVRNKVAAFLQTEMGTAMLSAMLSVGLSALPGSAGDVPQRLARELRVRSMADAGDLAAELLMGPLRELMATTLRGMPELSAIPAELPEAQPTVVEMPVQAPAKVGGNKS